MNPMARRETPLAIAALVLWVLTAAAGLVLFIAGSAARRTGSEQAPRTRASRPRPLSPPRRPR